MEQKKKKDDWKYVASGMAIFLIVAWYLCWIIVPAIPNSECVSTLCGGGGSSGGSSGGGSCDGGTPAGTDGGCPLCSDPTCTPPAIFDTGLGRCEDPSGIPDSDCCPKGYYWNSYEMRCYSDRGGSSTVCPANSIYDTGYNQCYCPRDYDFNPSTGCCLGSVPT